MSDKIEITNARIVPIFCANEQTETDHTATIDHNGEYVFTCECGRFIKVAGDADIKAALEDHAYHNEGQISAAQIEAENEEKLSVLDDLFGKPEKA